MAEHTQQLTRLGELIEHRREAFRAKTGREMSDDNVWLAQRRQEQRALQKIIAALKHPDHAVRGAGTPARTSPMTERGNPDNLRAASQRKHHDAVDRAERALHALVRDGDPMTFRAVAAR
jgi:hypothetical protein